MLTQDHRSENLSRQLKSKNINYNNDQNIQKKLKFSIIYLCIFGIRKKF